MNDLANAINAELDSLRPGSFCFWGHWFGKPYDNLHRIVGALAVGDIATIYLDCAETLIVERGRGWSLEGGRLLIPEAERVRFQWFEYGRLPSRESLRFEEYRRAGAGILFATDFQPQRRAELDPSMPAVQLHALY